MNQLSVTVEYFASNSGIETRTYASEVEDISISSNLTDDNSKPQFGVICQYGSLTLNDHDGKILKLAEEKKLRADMPVTIRLGDEIIGIFVTDKWDYSYGSNLVKVTLKDKILYWDNFNFSKADDKFVYAEEKEKWETGLVIFCRLNNFLYDALKYMVECDEDCKTKLKNIRIKAPAFREYNLRQAWENFCNVTQMVVYTHPDGKIKIKKRFS